MKKLFYSLLAAGSLLLATQGSVQAATGPATPDNPAEVQRKAAAREKVATAKKAAVLKRTAHRTTSVGEAMSHGLRVMLGLEESRAVTSPARRNRQLHRLQKQLKVRARMTSRNRMRHAHS